MNTTSERFRRWMAPRFQELRLEAAQPAQPEMEVGGMAYTYRADVTMTITVDVEANSFTMAEELIHQYLAPVSDDSRVDINSNDGIDLNNIQSDNDPEGDNDLEI